jgi:hypothetical protein
LDKGSISKDFENNPLYYKSEVQPSVGIKDEN